MNSSYPWILVTISILGFSTTIPLMIGIWNFGIQTLVTYMIQIDESWEAWKDIPVPIYFKVYVFNITNGKDLEKGVKPVLKELGPYVYAEKFHKTDISNEGLDSIRYRQIRKYEFKPELSLGYHPNDQITLLNIPLLAIAESFKHYTNGSILQQLNENIRSKSEHVTRKQSVHELLFSGFSTNIFIKKMSVNSNEFFPSQITGGKFSVFGRFRQNDEAWWRTNTGSLRAEAFARVETWDGQQKLKLWKNRACNSINGTDGIFFPPFLEMDQPLYIFSPDLCRSFLIKYYETSAHKGLNPYRFRVPLELFDWDRNRCFCPGKGKHRFYCRLNGISSIESCFDGMPLVISHPHFLGGDRKLLQMVEGLNPREDIHWGYFDLHPLTGLSVEIRHRFQFSVPMNPTPSFSILSNVSPAIVPLVWFEENGEMGRFDQYTLQLLDAVIFAWDVSKWISIFMFSILLIVGCTLIVEIRQNKLRCTPNNLLLVN